MSDQHNDERRRGLRGLRQNFSQDLDRDREEIRDWLNGNGSLYCGAIIVMILAWLVVSKIF
jgi:hypothetical protein